MLDIKDLSNDELEKSLVEIIAAQLKIHSIKEIGFKKIAE